MSAINLLITGRPRVGKTTLVKQLAQRLGDAAAGFTTGEIREGGNRVGFSIESLDGRRGILARQGLASPYTLGRYGVDVDAMDRIGTDALRRAIEDSSVRYIIVDEIGKMEEYSKAFRKAMIEALDCDKRVIATIRLHDSEYTRAIKARDDVELVRLTVPERDAIFERIEKMLFSESSSHRR